MLIINDDNINKCINACYDLNDAYTALFFDEDIDFVKAVIGLFGGYSKQNEIEIRHCDIDVTNSVCFDDRNKDGLDFFGELFKTIKDALNENKMVKTFALFGSFSTIKLVWHDRENLSKDYKFPSIVFCSVDIIPDDDKNVVTVINKEEACVFAQNYFREAEYDMHGISRD